MTFNNWVIILDTSQYMTFSLGHWIFSYQYLFSSIELKKIMQRTQGPSEDLKKKVLWSGIAVICAQNILFVIFGCCDIAKMGDINLFSLVTLLAGLIFDTVCTVMITIAVLNIGKISRMLPSHIKHSKTMIWSHIILFNLLNVLQILVVANSWVLYQKS